MDEGEILLWVIAAVVSLLIYYFIIKGAAGTKKRERQLQIMNSILLHLAKKQGVDADTLKQLEEMNNEA